THRLRFSLVFWRPEHDDSIFVAAAQSLQQLNGVVAASVINENEIDARLREKVKKLSGWQSPAFIVARHNNGYSGLAHDPIITGGALTSRNSPRTALPNKSERSLRYAISPRRSPIWNILLHFP